MKKHINYIKSYECCHNNEEMLCFYMLAKC
uniref:Uncharacterized protein n=1 Tax=Arundo donax TaxID=35708 RepID=A0A0A9CD27_ARUDO